MNLTDWARANGIHPVTARRWYRDGLLPMPVTKIGNTVLVDPERVLHQTTPGIGLYARVSSHEQKPDLERQIARLTRWAADTDHPILQTEAEIGSGMNGSRIKIRRLLANPRITTIVVEHRDRLGRMNTELIEAALSATNRKLVILDGQELDDDLVRDMTDILTSFCARLYGRRTARNRALKALTCAQNDNPTIEPARSEPTVC